MQKRGKAHLVPVPLRYFKSRAALGKFIYHSRRDGGRSERMFKARMVCGRICCFGASELAYVAQTLKKRRVDYLYLPSVIQHRTPYSVVNDLARGRRGGISVEFFCNESIYSSVKVLANSHINRSFHFTVLSVCPTMPQNPSRKVSRHEPWVQSRSPSQLFLSRSLVFPFLRKARSQAFFCAVQNLRR